MATQERISRILLSGGTGSREWIATADVTNTAAGGSVNVTITQTSSGATPPGEANTLELRMANDSGTVIRTFDLTEASASQSVTFHFTDTGATGGAARCGTIELKLYAQRTSLGTYEVESDGSPNTPPTGFNSTLDRGWIRGTTTLTEAISNVSLGGAKTEPAEYDESLFVRTTSGHVSYVARALTVQVSDGGPSAATNSTTAAQRDVTFSNVVDDRFPAAATTVGVTVTVPNATLTGSPDWTYTTTTDDSISVDPRLTATLHFQVNDNSFANASHVEAKEMLSTDSGFLWAKITAARGTGKNSITLTQTLTPTNPGTAVGPTSSSTTTQDGTVGVSGRIDWTASKPGGSWAWTVDVTAPADIDADTHLTGSDTLTMLAPDPNVIGWPYVLNSEPDDHLHPGSSIQVVLTISNRSTGLRIEADVGSPMVSIVRYNLTLSHYEYLDTDEETFVEWAVGTEAAEHSLTESPASSRIYQKTFTLTDGWGTTDLLGISCRFKVSGTPYEFKIPRELVGDLNPHASVAVSGWEEVG